MDDANLSPDNIDLINVNANSSKLQDLVEAKAINELFEERGEEIPVCAPKSALGECYGASGAMQTAVSALTIDNGLIPPTNNCTEKDLECNLNIISEKTEKSINTVLVNSFDYSGNNSCLLVKKYE
jgi:3-oxoacyl-[acyl-carrier-protein] synthase II